MNLHVSITLKACRLSEQFVDQTPAPTFYFNVKQILSGQEPDLQLKRPDQKYTLTI